MARRYDLGSVVGEIRFTYDKNGVLRARDDMGRFIKQTDDAGTHFDLFSKRGVAAAGKVAKAFGIVALAMGSLAGGLNILNSVVVAVAQLSQAVALLPGLIAGFAGVIGTVVLGVDGIKKAFEGLKPTLDTLKSQVSATFESGLAPAVRDLKVILPQLTQGFKNIAGAIAATATSFTAMLKQQQSINALNNILNQTAKITTNIGKALAPLGQAFLSIASIGLSFITPMTAGLGNLARQFNAWVQSAHGQAAINDMIKTGIEAFKVLFGIISQIGGIIGAVFDGLSTSTGNFGSSLVETLRSVKEFLKSAEGFNALQAIGQTLQEVGTAVRTVLLKALEELAPSIPPLMQAFSQLAQQVLPPLISLLEIVGPILFKISEALADNMNWIGPLIIGLYAWAKVQALLNVLMAANPIGLVIIALAALVAAVALVITNWDTIAAFFKGVWDAVWKWTSDRITDIRDFIVGTWNDIYKWFSDRLTDIKDFFVNIWNNIVSFFEGIGNRIASAAGSVIDWFAALPGKIGDFLVSLPGKLWDAFVEGFKLAVEAVKQGAEWIIAGIVALNIKVIQLIAQAGKAIVDGFVNAFQWLVTNIPIFFNNVIAFFVALPSQIIAGVVNFATMLGTWFTNAWNTLTTTAASLVTGFVAWVQSLPQMIVDALISFGSLLLTWVTDAFNTAWDWAVQRGAEFIVWVSGLPGRILDTIWHFIQDLGNWARQAFQAMIDTAVRKAAEFISWVSGLPNRILSFFLDLGNRMVSIGEDIVRGIWQGIQNLAGWLWNQATDFVEGIVDKVQSLLDIGSPSKVFADEVGRWIPAGIAQGIDNNAAIVANSIQSLFNNAVPNVKNIVTPLGQAAQQILDQLNSGGNLFEDFSFRGNSDLVSQFNDQITTMFHPSTGDWSTTSADEVAGFLRNLISTQTSSVPQSVTTSTASNSQVTIQNLNVAGNLDPTNPAQWRQALVNIKDGIRDVERQYA